MPLELPFYVMLQPTPLPVRPAFDGYVECRRSYGVVHRRHRHVELECNLVRSGRARYIIGSRTYELLPGTVAWLFADHEHVLVDQSPNHEMWVLVFRPRLARRVCTAPDARVLRQRNPTGDFCRKLPLKQAQSLDVLLREVFDARGDAQRFNAGLSFALLQAWTLFSGAKAASEMRPLHPAVERAARLLKDAGGADDMDAEDLATECGLSVSRLGRLFKQQTGVSIADFRNRLRIDRFLELYGAGEEISMLKAATDAGFGSYTQFHRVFVEMMGVSPRRYGTRRNDATLDRFRRGND